MTEDDTFNALRRTPLDGNFLDIVEPQRLFQRTFLLNLDFGHYDLILSQHGWTPEDFNEAYCLKYVKR